MKRINAKYIKEKYDLDTEKNKVQDIRKVGGLHGTDFDGLTIREFKNKMILELAKYQDSDMIDISYYGYDGGYDCNILRAFEREETKDEVISRLISAEKNIRQGEAAIKKAKAILEKYNEKAPN